MILDLGGGHHPVNSALSIDMPSPTRALRRHVTGGDWLVPTGDDYREVPCSGIEISQPCGCLVARYGNRDLRTSLKKGGFAAAPQGLDGSGYIGQIFQITPVPGNWTRGLSAGSSHFEAGSD